MSVFRLYEDFVQTHHAWYLPILETVKSLTLLLPGRFDQNMIQSESIYSSLNLIGLYNNTILDRPRGVVATLKCGPESRPVVYAKHLLMVLELTEVLLEMIASKHYQGNKVVQSKKWNVILLIESIKTSCRLLMLYNNGGRMVLPASPLEIAFDTEQLALSKARAHAKQALTAQPTGKYDDLISIYISKDRGKMNPHGTYTIAPTPPPPHPRESLQYHPAAPEVLSEVFFHSRPVLYVLGRCFCKEDSWLPVIFAVACDAASRKLTPTMAELSPGQRAEISRRSTLWLLYLLRTPVFEKFTKVPLEFIIRLLSKIPLFGSIFSGIMSVILSLQTHYFYTSGS